MRLASAALAIAVALVLLIAMLLLNAPPARGHSPAGWAYPPDCCGGHDCAPVDSKRVRVVQGGFLLDGKHFIPTSRVRLSQDDDYHACFWPNPDTLHCFFIPPQGS